MRFENVLAVAPVSDLAVATRWYTALFGREPDNHPMQTLVEWKVTGGGWVQVFRTDDSPGATAINLSVDDLDAAVAAVRGRGLEPGDVVGANKGVRLAALRDPDGNTVTLIGGFRAEY